MEKLMLSDLRGKALHINVQDLEDRMKCLTGSAIIVTDKTAPKKIRRYFVENSIESIDAMLSSKPNHFASIW